VVSQFSICEALPLSREGDDSVPPFQLGKGVRGIGRNNPLQLWFPFPRGKGLGVRFLVFVLSVVILEPPREIEDKCRRCLYSGFRQIFAPPLVSVKK
jgi:hypothetical protein